MAQDDLDTKPAKRFDYSAFIEDLRPLLAESTKFPANQQSAGSASFKRWKLRLTDLLDRIEALGYDVRCGVHQRMFANMYGSGSDRVWVAHMMETIDEIELIIQNFETYGDPGRTRKGRTSWFGEGQVPPKAEKPAPAVEPVAAPKPSPVPAPLPAPEKVTIGWMIHNVDWKGWTAIASVLAAVAFGSYKAGQVRLFDDAQAKPASAQSSTPSQAPAALQSSKPASKA